MKNVNQKIQELLNLFKSKKFIDAEILAKQSIEKYPNNVFLYNFLGLVLSELKRNDEAINIYKQGIKIDKNFSLFYNNLGIIYQSQGEYKKARIFYDKAVKLDKKLPEVQNNLGNLSRILNNEKEAIIFFKKAINIKSSFFPAYFNLGILYKNIGEFEKARFYLREATKINPNLYAAHRNLSEIIKYTKDNRHLNLLIKIYNDNINNSINKKEIAFALGKAFEDMNIYDKAFKYYNDGNNLQRKTFNFSIDEEQKEINSIKEKFSREFLNKNNLIMKNAFKSENIIYEPELEWLEGNTDTNEKSINPDFLIKREDDILHLRKQFIEEHKLEVYDEAVTLCHEHHLRLHSIYGKRPRLVTALKQKRWVDIQRDKYGMV